jgi:hypothetical protein
MCEVGSFVANRETYLKPGEPLATFLHSIQSADDPDALRSLAAHFILLEHINSLGWNWDIATEESIGRVIGNALVPIRRFLDMQAFTAALQQTSAKRFDPFAWNRRDNPVADPYPF